MSASTIQASNASPAAPAPGTAVNARGFNFHALLSALNPLQYLPIVGTIYRAATGDVIPDAVRYAGSLIVSGLIGGPIGLLSNIAVTIAEKATGIDPEKIIAAEFHSGPFHGGPFHSGPSHRGPAEADKVLPPPNATPAPASVTTLVVAASESTQLALSPQQLAAYGVRVSRSGTLQMGDIRGADVLNTIELARLSNATSAYAANQTMTLAIATRGP
jgi:hypothetical protein